MDIPVTNKTNKSWEVVYLISKVRQLVSKHSVRKIVSSVLWRAVQTEKMECVVLNVFDASTTSINVWVKSRFVLNAMLEQM